jgi:hypothetical protein
MQFRLIDGGSGMPPMISRAVLALHVRNVGRAAVRFHPQQFFEVDRLALRFQRRASWWRPSAPSRRWHPPQRAVASSRPSFPLRTIVIRKHAGHRCQIAYVSVRHAKEYDPLQLRRLDGQNIGHRTRVAELLAQSLPVATGKGRRVIFRSYPDIQAQRDRIDSPDGL